MHSGGLFYAAPIHQHMSRFVRYADIGNLPAFVGFTSSEKNYRSELKMLKIPDPYDPKLEFANHDHPARCINLYGHGDTHELLVFIVLDRDSIKNVGPHQLAAVLAHEAVHAKQRVMAFIGEDAPGAELEAYFVQAVVQHCIHEYMEGR